jgi:DNA-directed RNA polymerase subunit M/transcription elongation factor TFIIS
MEEDKKPMHFNEKIEKTEKGNGILDLNQEDTTKGFPHVCKKCDCEFSEVLDLGISYSDESSVILFKCKKCGNVERDAYGSSNV